MNFPTIIPLSAESLTIEFGNEISEKINKIAVNFSHFITQNAFEGFIESVPAYASVTVFYDFYKVRKYFSESKTAFQIVESILKEFIKKSLQNLENVSRTVEIPANFDEKYAPDLKFVAEMNNLSIADVIEIFTSQIYRVFMIGFLPGFAYMGKLDERIAAPRKKTPRLEVPQGSIGIAGRQTGIYPLQSPGGWQIIGRTKIEMFDLNRSDPCYLQVGDTVKFYESSL